ncbi:MAG: hypothetical protein AAGE94_25420, partial [Acidobacteriota bacterium]
MAPTDPEPHPSIRPTFLADPSSHPDGVGRLRLRHGDDLVLATASSDDAPALGRLLRRLDGGEGAAVAKSLGIEPTRLTGVLRRSDVHGWFAHPTDDPTPQGFAALRLDSDGNAHVTLAVDPATRQLGLATLLL